MVLSENTSSIGNPEISFTEYNDPDNESVIEKSSPCEPCTVNTGCDEPEPYTVNEGPLIVSFDDEMNILEAVTLVVTKIEFNAASEPDTMTFFQFGIYTPHVMVRYIHLCRVYAYFLAANNIFSINIDYLVFRASAANAFCSS